MVHKLSCQPFLYFIIPLQLDTTIIERQQIRIKKMAINDLKPMIEYARRLHGHVGPYVVIGLRMGFSAKKALNIGDKESTLLTAEVSVPLHPPFSCLLDGVQVSTTCTVGNQRLQFKNAKTIHAIFSSQKNAKAVKVTLTKEFTEQLEQKTKQDKLDEAFAWEISELPENQLFDLAVKESMPSALKS
jgi:formylmethanofuran dehydrogenase subunit E